MKLTTAIKRNITNDWAGAFPTLGVFRPMWLLRRVGPIVIGICLNRGAAGTSFRPTWHVHLLLRELDFISLTLAQYYHSKNGSVSSIDAQWHEKYFATAVERVRKCALLPWSGDIHLRQALEAYDTWLGQQSSPYWPHEMEDRILLCGWLGNESLMERSLKNAEKILRNPSPKLLKPIADVDGWLTRVASAAADRSQLERILAEQIEFHKLKNLPYSELLP